MFQNWRDLLFAHFDCDPAELQSLLPPGLEVDTYQGRAFVGLIPFRVQGLRPPFLPPLPWLSAFPETNVRTYVQHKGQNPGIWFFSLDAARWLACRFANLTMKLPYKHARMSIDRMNQIVDYKSERIDDPKPAALQARWQFGKDLGTAKEGALEFFLIERYVLYSQSKTDLFRCQVHHRPYQLIEIVDPKIETSLVVAARIPQRPWVHFAGCRGVDVEVFKLERA